MLQYNAKMALLAVSVLGIVGTLVLGQLSPVLAQTLPAQSNLEKRNYAFLNDRHLTARFGNDKVCGDHLCAPGEWAKLQENLNHAQILHPSNATEHIQTPPAQVPTAPVNSTSIPLKNVTSSAPMPLLPTPPSHVCTAVKAALVNSTAPNVVAKVLADLGCI